MSHFRFVQDWLEGWNSRSPGRIMAHYAEDAVFQSPSVLALGGSSDGIVRGKREITEFTRRAFERFPKLRFELEDVIERAGRVIVVYRKLDVFSAKPGLTKTEQADLLMAMYGRHGESPVPVLAAATPADCFITAFEAVRIAFVEVFEFEDDLVKRNVVYWSAEEVASRFRVSS